MKRLLDTLIAYWKMVVSMGDYALNPPTHLSRDWEDANSIGRAKSMGKSDQPKRISSLLSSERRKLRNHSVRATTGTQWLRAEDSRLQERGGRR